MSTEFFREKIIKRCIAILTVCFNLFCFGYAQFLSQVKTVEIQKGFFYLVREETNVEVGIEFVKLEGGAGYLLRQNGKEYVVLSAYLKEKDGLAVQANMLNGEDTHLLYIGVDTLYFKTNKEKKNADVYIGALQTFFEYMEVFDRAISLLENGATQESVKRILLPLSRQFDYLSEEYAKFYLDFADVSHYFAEIIDRYCAEILFVGDLRYVLCLMTEEYLMLASAFSI